MKHSLEEYVKGDVHTNGIEQLKSLLNGMEGHRLTYKALIRDNGLSSGARAA